MGTSFKLEHIFEKISLEKFIKYLNAPKLNKMLEEGLQFDERTLLSQKKSTDDIEWNFKVKKCSTLPASIQKIVRANEFVWYEHSRLVHQENCIYWSITPATNTIKYRGQGVWKLYALKNGCKRIIEGTVVVDIPLIGKIVEGFIVNELKKSYEVEPLIQKKFYASVD